MPDMPAFERLLKRDRIVTLAGLAALCALSWLYLAYGAGLGMSAWDMTTLALFPHRQAVGAPGWSSPAWGSAQWTLIVAMWWIMMIAMMTPSAAPTILLYARVHRHAGAQARSQSKPAPTAWFVAGYLLAWLVFSILAAAAHWALEGSGLVAAMMMGSRNRWLSAAVLLAAGIYQLSPFKHACLVHCRTPQPFLSRHWRPGPGGALRLGVLHGAYCVGCCWLLMMLLFVGGVMNLVWIAALAVLVLIEKAAPPGPWIGRVAGVVLIAWGTATLVV